MGTAGPASGQRQLTSSTMTAALTAAAAMGLGVMTAMVVPRNSTGRGRAGQGVQIPLSQRFGVLPTAVSQPQGRQHAARHDAPHGATHCRTCKPRPPPAIRGNRENNRLRTCGEVHEPAGGEVAEVAGGRVAQPRHPVGQAEEHAAQRDHWCPNKPS